jgi:DNA-binding GntR family transcriptional regulator
LIQTLKGLEALTYLAILSFARSETSACLPHEHNAVLEAIEESDGAKAKSLMGTHLDHALNELDLSERLAQPLNLSAGLGFTRSPASRRRSRLKTA